MAITTSGTTLTFNDATTQTTAPVNTNANVTSATAVAGTGISITAVTTTGAATHTVTNTGVTSAVAGRGIAVSGATGAVTVSAAAGAVLQVVYSSTNTTTTSTTTTRNGANTGLSASITPSSSSSKILVLWQLAGSVDPTNNIYVNLLRNGATELLIGSGGTVNATAKGYGIAYVDNLANSTGSGSFLDSPATTSATTYGLYFWVQGATGYINRSSSNPAGVVVTSSITLLEIAG